MSQPALGSNGTERKGGEGVRCEWRSVEHRTFNSRALLWLRTIFRLPLLFRPSRPFQRQLREQQIDAKSSSPSFQ
jgi:hypothetical protein